MSTNGEEYSKKCPDCGEAKPVEAFSKNPSRPDGLQFYCKSCYSKRGAQYYRARQAKRGRTVRERIDVPEGMKLCPRCGVIKPHDAFDRSSYQYDGLSAHCKSCKAVYARRRYFRKTHGIEPEEVEVMLREQDGRCAICSREISITTAHLDHNHQTGAVRALLCFNCNSSLGKLSDDPAIFRRASEYLEGYQWSPADRERVVRRLARIMGFPEDQLVAHLPEPLPGRPGAYRTPATR